MSDIVYMTGASNTPSIASAATALAANTKRLAWAIQNLGTNPLYVLLGAGASATVFHFALKAASVNDDGTGGVLSSAMVSYTGLISIAGTSPRYTALEIAP